MSLEFATIAKFFQDQQPFSRDDVITSSGDDCAVLRVPESKDLVVSIDTMNLATHFFPDTPAHALGHKIVAVSLSDCAAMGAIPAWITVTASLEQLDEIWLSAFAKGMFSLLNRHKVLLVGGDLSRGPMSFTSQIHGFVSRGQALTQAGAQAGDDIYVTGTLGDAALAVATKNSQEPKYNATKQAAIESRLYYPNPPVSFAAGLYSLAHSAIDLSDGLVQDLSRLIKKSNVGAEITTTQLPLSTVLKSLDLEKAHYYALKGGDDYELCFTAPRASQKALFALAKRTKTALSLIGTITDSGKLEIRNAAHETISLAAYKGFSHFQ